MYVMPEESVLGVDQVVVSMVLTKVVDVGN